MSAQPAGSLAGALATAVASPASGLPAPARSQPAAAEQIERGRAVYREQYCGICHGAVAAESRTLFSPSLDDIGATAAARIAQPTYQGEATTAAAYIHESLVAPDAFVVEEYVLTPHSMPSYQHLPQEDLAALVHFLLQQE